jgi:hypothetical protein
VQPGLGDSVPPIKITPKVDLSHLMVYRPAIGGEHMIESYDLGKLNPDAFEHLVNLIALRILGPGHTGFGPGPDGGRDGYFEGEAPYPSTHERWSGRWYIQSKFLKPNVATNANKWLLDRIREELQEFQKPGTRRVWPDIWIVATNIDPSGTPNTGVFDASREEVEKARPQLKNRFAIWGGRKILDLLVANPDIAEYYSNVLRPVHSSMLQQLSDQQAQPKEILHHLIVTQLLNQRYTKLEEAGSKALTRPGIQQLFTDVPFECRESSTRAMAARCLAQTIAQNHRLTDKYPNSPGWRGWLRHPTRARIWVVKGGPGQGKSTLAQYVCQVQRAALILEENGPPVGSTQRDIANDIRAAAEDSGFWPIAPRVPVFLELKEFARWFAQHSSDARGVSSYLAARHLAAALGQTVHVGTLKRCFGAGRWLFIFDGLDEVPSDIKDSVANEVIHFIDDFLIECSADALSLCTSRPQGYSGQFADLEAAFVDLARLSPEEALACALPVLKIDRSEEESSRYYDLLKRAIESTTVKEIMTTPLQAHIMAIVVRDGGSPPERRWQLYTTFYNVIKKREADRDLPNARLATLLRGGDKLLKSLHNRIGFELHAHAETSKRDQTFLSRDEFDDLVEEIVKDLQDDEVEETVATLREATTERLVLISTPESGNQIRFEITPLQEFFAAEFMYQSVTAEELRRRLRIIAGDSHWREVIHFVISALVEQERSIELSVTIQTLDELNNPIDYKNSRYFAYRRGSGAIITARLLQEGVFEQDKNVRQQFQHSLEPLSATTDPSIYRILTDVQRPHSRSWLRSFLLDSLDRLQESENIGASIALAGIISDGDENVDRLSHCLKTSSAPYRACLFQTLVSGQQSSPRRFSRWVMELAFDSLLSPTWIELGTAGVGAALTILRSEPSALEEISTKLGVSRDLAKICADLICDERRAATSEKENIRGTSEDLGIFTVKFRKGPEQLIYRNWDESLWRSMSDAKGIFQCVYRVFRLAQSKSLDALHDLADSVSSELDFLAALPAQVRVFLPFDTDWLQELGNEWARMSAEELEREFKSRKIGLIPNWQIKENNAWKIDVVPKRKRNTNVEKATKAQWTRFVEAAPALALALFRDPELSDLILRRGRWRFGLGSDVADWQEREAETLLRRLLEVPFMLLSAPEAWGRFIDLCPSLEHQLRGALTTVADAHETERESFGPIFPFPVEVRSEAALLPHVFNMLMGSAQHERHFYHTLPGRLSRSTGTVKSLREEGLEKRIEGFVPHAHSLKEVIENSAYSKRVRASALMMYLCQPQQDPLKSMEYRSQLVDLYEPGLSTWYLKGAALCLEHAIGQNEAEALAIMGTVLKLGKDDYRGRVRLDPTFEKWRETSTAPVRNAISHARPIMDRNLGAAFRKATNVG